MENSLYNTIADRLIKQIKDGVYNSGDKLLSVRAMAKQQGVSVSTILAAYAILEDRGFAEVRLKSGYYVHRPKPKADKPPPKVQGDCCQPIKPSKAQRIMEVMQDGANSKFINFSSAVADSNFPITNQLRKVFSSVVRTQKFVGIGYDAVKGSEALRREIAKRAMDAGILASPDDIVITAGCQNALDLALRTLTKPGDIIAVETPCYYGLLQLIESCGLKAIEIPTDASTGMSIDALQLALEQWPIKAVISIPSYNNPFGSVMPDAHKQQLIELINQHEIYLIEDDVYAELGYNNQRPKAIKSFDTQGRVLLCSSVSKTLDPGMRVGWIIPGSHLDKVQHLQFVSNVAVSRLPQLVTAQIISRGSYDRHLRLAREAYRQRRDQLLDLIDAHFPEDTRVSKPQGGFVLWVQLPKAIDTSQLYDEAREQGVSISPGDIFSLDNKYHSCIRLTYAESWSDKRITAIQVLGGLINQQLQKALSAWIITHISIGIMISKRPRRLN